MKRAGIAILGTIQLAVALWLLGVYAPLLARLAIGAGWLWPPLRLIVLAWDWLVWLALLATVATTVAVLLPPRWTDGVRRWQVLFLEALVVLAPVAKLALSLVDHWVGAAGGAAAWIDRGVLAAHLAGAGLLAAWLPRVVSDQTMDRIQMGVGLWVEVGLVAVLGIALALGGLGRDVFFWVWVLGVLTGVAVAVAWVTPARILGKVVTHGALLIGCVVFAFPFVWLISTSFKYDEEMFVYPPKWVPAAPPRVERSPYVISTEAYRHVRKPDRLAPAHWRRVWPKLREAIWRKGERLLSGELKQSVDAEALRKALVHGLWSSASPGVPEQVWEPPEDAPGEQVDRRILDAVLDRIDADRTNEVWNTIHRYVGLRDPRVKDLDLNECALGPAALGPAATATAPATAPTKKASYLHLWRPNDKGIRCVRRPAEAGSSAGDPLVLEYDFRASSEVSASAELPLPIDTDDLLSISLPIREDRSWHKVRFVLEMGGKRYINEDSLFLGNYRWQELTLKLKDRDSADERDQGIWPMVCTAEAGAYDQPRKLRLTIVLEQSSRLGAIWNKYVDSYRRAYIATQHRWRYLFNSTYLVVLNVLGQILSCSLVAYAFARLKWPGRDVLFAVMLATMMLPAQVTMIPVFLIFKKLAWYNTLKALWVPAFLGNAFFIFMLRQFMKSIPTELEDAAKIDGCGFFGVYWRIILPLMKPALAAVAIFTFMATWNNFMGPLIYINDQRLYPLALGLFEFRSQHGGEYGMLMAASTMMTLPVVAIFFLAQKYFIQGVTLTGMKG